MSEPSQLAIKTVMRIFQRSFHGKDRIHRFTEQAQREAERDVQAAMEEWAQIRAVVDQKPCNHHDR